MEKLCTLWMDLGGLMGSQNALVMEEGGGGGRCSCRPIGSGPALHKRLCIAEVHKYLKEAMNTSFTYMSVSKS